MIVLLSGGSCLGVDVFSLGWTTQSHTHNHNSEASPQTVYVHVVITQKEHTPIFSIVYSKALEDISNHAENSVGSEDSLLWVPWCTIVGH